uniref:Uncharacterized protein n=1 Tax=Sus scrofa TaxID=9823 RepID=A0A8D1SIU2_PIG
MGAGPGPGLGSEDVWRKWAELDCEAGWGRGSSVGAESGGRAGAEFRRWGGERAELGPRGSGLGGGAPATQAPSSGAFHPSGSEFHSSPPPSAWCRLSARPSPLSIVARSLRRPSPQCRAPTGTWACRWRRARKARMTASGKQNMLPSTPCWTRSTPVWTTWRRRMTTSTPASRSCLNPTGRRALNSSSSSGRPPAMPAPRLWELPARPQPCLPEPGSG